VISDLIQSGGFPPLFLQPINFEQVYGDSLKRRQGQAVN
jgi:preprotein translocase subunit SecB